MSDEGGKLKSKDAPSRAAKDGRGVATRSSFTV